MCCQCWRPSPSLPRRSGSLSGTLRLTLSRCSTPTGSWRRATGPSWSPCWRNWWPACRGRGSGLAWPRPWPELPARGGALAWPVMSSSKVGVHRPLHHLGSGANGGWAPGSQEFHLAAGTRCDRVPGVGGRGCGGSSSGDSTEHQVPGWPLLATTPSCAGSARPPVWWPPVAWGWARPPGRQSVWRTPSQRIFSQASIAVCCSVWPWPNQGDQTHSKLMFHLPHCSFSVLLPEAVCSMFDLCHQVTPL